MYQDFNYNIRNLIVLVMHKNKKAVSKETA